MLCEEWLKKEGCLISWEEVAVLWYRAKCLSPRLRKPTEREHSLVGQLFYSHDPWNPLLPSDCLGGLGQGRRAVPKEPG